LVHHLLNERTYPIRRVAYVHVLLRRNGHHLHVCSALGRLFTVTTCATIQHYKYKAKASSFNH
jgi:hypothetical protein